MQTHAVEGLFLSIQFHSGCDNAGRGIYVEVLPVSVTTSSLQEGIADLSVHPLICVCCMYLIHRQAWGLLLWAGAGDSLSACELYLQRLTAKNIYSFTVLGQIWTFYLQGFCGHAWAVETRCKNDTGIIYYHIMLINHLNTNYVLQLGVN